MNTKLQVIHFNDVYQLTRPKLKADKENENKLVPDMKVIDLKGNISDTSSHIILFYEKIKSIRDKWGENSSNEPEGLVLFSGDLFSPSVESSVTRGSNMVHLMNEIVPDVAVPGNHEFDFGLQRFDTLVEFCKFPWVATNLKEPSGKKVKRLNPYIVIERADLRIGVVGLLSADTWRKTNTQVQKSLNRLEMLDACKKSVPKLRKPKSECEGCEKGEDCEFGEDCKMGEGCDLVFGLTHALHYEDITLAREVGAYPGEWDKCVDIPYGVDILFGGHDHEYFLGKGVQRGPGSERRNDGIAEHKDDDGLLIIKSGSDFFDLSELEIEVAEIYEAKHRKKVVKSVTVSRHHFKFPIPSQQPVPTRPSAITRMLNRQLNNEIVEALAKPVAILDTKINMNSEISRTMETALGNWVADALFEWYGRHQVERAESEPIVPTVFVMNGGAVRGNGELNEGYTLLQRDIIQILPFNSTLKLLRVKYSDLKAVLGAMIKGKSDFPIVSGMKVEWSPDKGEVKRVIIESGSARNKEKPIEATADEPGTEPNSENAYIDVLTNEYVTDHETYFGPVEKTNRTACEELPTYQILLYYINDRARAPDDLRPLISVLEEISKLKVEELEQESESTLNDINELLQGIEQFLATAGLPHIKIQELKQRIEVKF